jgi:small neutral amino acid transporter SnatA (MarC family)
MTSIFESTALLLALLNPFLLVVYLIGPMKRLTRIEFRSVVARAGFIASIVFCSFAVLGDAIFANVIQADFASFQIFGGVVFVLIGLQFIFRGPTAIEILHGEHERISGAIAIPVLIGPGTISACVIIGKRHEPILACAAVFLAVFLSLVIVLLLKALHDFVLPRKEALIERYIEIAGRITALYVGTIAVEMIMRGIGTWINNF